MCLLIPNVLITGQQELPQQCNEGIDINSAISAALEKQNALLRKYAEEKEDEISNLEREIAQMKNADNGTLFHPPAFNSFDSWICVLRNNRSQFPHASNCQIFCVCTVCTVVIQAVDCLS